MVKIKITKGVFGLRVGIFTQTKTKNDPPFEIDDSIAARLVKQGVAEIVSGDVNSKSNSTVPVKNSVHLGKETAFVNKKAASEEPVEEAMTANEDREEAHTEEESNGISYSMEDTKARLLEVAHELGIEADSRLNKAEIIALLDDATTGESPSFGDVDGVVE